MNTLRLKSISVAGLASFSFSASFVANAVEPATASAQAEIPYCRMESGRVAVWPHGPWKGVRGVRFETRTRFACEDAKADYQPARAAPTVVAYRYGPRQR